MTTLETKIQTLERKVSSQTYELAKLKKLIPAKTVTITLETAKELAELADIYEFDAKGKCPWCDGKSDAKLDFNGHCEDCALWNATADLSAAIRLESAK